MFDKLKEYLVTVAVQKYAPVAMMSALTAVGALFMAHQGMLETWGVNYIAFWSADWLKTHTISGPILLIELDTTSSAAIAGIIGLVALLSRAGEHHTVGAYLQAKSDKDEAPPTAPNAA